jgi:hypothetical protein
MTDYALALNHLRVDAKWILNGDDYEGLDWLDDREKPTKAELEKAYAEALATLNAEAAAKKAAKASALAKLEALGLTADEAQAIAGF